MPDTALAAKEADALVSYVAARAREGRSRDVLRAAHVLLGAFLLAVRLRELVQVLELARDAAERVGDAAEQAWVLYNLGTLAAASGRAPAAAGLLEAARTLFEQAGDHPGTAASAHGLTPGGQAGTLGKATAIVTAHKLAAVAVGVLVVAAAPGFLVAGGTWYGVGGDGGSAEILGFGARTGEDGGGKFDEERGWTRLPGSAVDPGGTIRVCDPLYIDSYVRLEGLHRGARWSLAAAAEDESFGTTYTETWRRRGAYTSGVQSYHGPPGGSSTGEPVPYGRWTIVVRIQEDERARESVTLVEDC